jgi:aminomethyltransferase
VRSEAADQAERLWDAIVARPGGDVTLAGLGARDSLRLEVGYPLYGNDVDDTTTPLEGGLGWIVKLNKPDFLGRMALEMQQAKGLTRKLVGFTLTEKGFPRAHMPVLVDGRPSGEVRSGTVSPSLGIPIGTAYVPLSHVKPGSQFTIDIRGKQVGAEVVALPFYTKGSRR